MDAASPDAPTSPIAPLVLGAPWRHDFAALGPDFYTELAPTPLPGPRLVALNESLAARLGLDAQLLASPPGVAAFSGNTPLAGARPLASVYSGHQFGVWAGQLGDGRAILLGAIAPPDGTPPQELQLKGAGLTPYSRMGDGRAVLRSSIREYLASEAMHGLGIPTTRALMLTASPAPVRREEIETAAVLTRVAPSFIRFGHFEHFAAREQTAQLRALADHVLAHHYAPCLREPQPYAALLREVTLRTADLVAQWQAVGFCHGVMNTDNMSILGLTIDYGPFQFMDGFDPGHICNHSDERGRYAYHRQPHVAFWNLHCLAQALLPLIGEQRHALAALEQFKDAFQSSLERRLAGKLGLARWLDPDRALAEGLFKLMAAGRTDYTLFWQRLTDAVAAGFDAAGTDTVRDLFVERTAFDAWLLQYRERLKQTDIASAADLMQKSNPRRVLRNHLCELAIRDAKAGDFSGVTDLAAALRTPYTAQPVHDARYAGFPPEWASQIEVSCSS